MCEHSHAQTPPRNVKACRPVFGGGARACHPTGHTPITPVSFPLSHVGQLLSRLTDAFFAIQQLREKVPLAARERTPRTLGNGTFEDVGAD